MGMKRAERRLVQATVNAATPLCQDKRKTRRTLRQKALFCERMQWPPELGRHIAAALRHRARYWKR